MNIIIPTFLSMVLLLVLAEWFLPAFMRPDNLFGITIDPASRSHPEVRALLRNWRIVVLSEGVLAVGAILIAANFLPITAAVVAHTGVILLLVGAELAQIVIFHGRAQAFAIPTTGAVRVAPLQPTAQRTLVPWWWEALPLAMIAATAIILASQYAAAPAIIPIHWDASGHANGFADKSILSFYQLVWTQLGLWVLMTAITLSLRFTRIGNNASTGAATMRVVLARFLFVIKVGILALLGGLAIVTVRSAVDGTSPSPALVGLPLGLMLLIFVAVGVIIVRYGQSGWRLNRATNMQVPGDGTPDSKWIGGIIYFNRDDPSLLVERRLGIGVTFNFAHPASWLLFGGILVVTVGLVIVAKLGAAH